MLSGLYGDLPQAKTAKDGEGSSSAVPATAGSTWTLPKLAPPVRKAPAFAPPPSILRAGRGKPGVGPSGGQPGRQRPEMEARPMGPPSGTLGEGLEDEYDPGRPNDYESVCRERERARKDAEMEVQRQERLRQQEAEQQEAERVQAERDAAMAASMRPPEDREAALNLSGEEAFARRARLSNRPSGFSDAPGPGGLGFGGPPGVPATPAQGARGMSLAAQMMEKMGWKEGQGLGKSLQGMSTPLMAQKTDGRSGVIVNAAPEERYAAPPPEKKPRGVNLSNPTRVVMLRNMVGPGEVDDDLEDEVGMEASKYGKVEGVFIFEVTEPGFPEDQAVRIFVRFDRVEAATKSLVDMEGRFFGGRTVRATFFDEGKFDRSEFAPMAGEFD